MGRREGWDSDVEFAEAWAFLQAAERVRLRMQMERGDRTAETLAFEQWLWHDRWMTSEKWMSLHPRDRDAYLNAFVRERAARRMVERAYAGRRWWLAWLVGWWGRRQ